MTTMPNTTLPHLVNQPGQPSTETHGAGMTTMPNTMLPHLVNQPGQPSTETHGAGMTTMPNTTLPHLVNQPGQPSTETHGAGMTTMPNTTLGSAAMPATVTHTQPSHVAPGTDPLSSRGEGGHPTFRRRWVPLPIYKYVLLFFCGY